MVYLLKTLLQTARSPRVKYLWAIGDILKAGSAAVLTVFLPSSPSQ